MPDQIEEVLQQVRALPPRDQQTFLLRLLDVTDPWSLPYPPFVFSSIVKTPGICGGAARLIRTRIPVWTIEQMRRDGAGDADILAGHPTLTAEDLLQARWYARMFKEEIDYEIESNERGFAGQTAP